VQIYLHAQVPSVNIKTLKDCSINAVDTKILYMSNRLEKGPKAKDIVAQTDRQTYRERCNTGNP